MYGCLFTIPISLLLYSGGQLFHHMAILIFTFASPVQCTHICFSKMQCFFLLSSFLSPVFTYPFHTSYPLNSEKKERNTFCGWGNGEYCCSWIERKESWQCVGKAGGITGCLNENLFCGIPIC